MTTCGLCTSPAHGSVDCPVKPATVLDSGSNDTVPVTVVDDKAVIIIDDPLDNVKTSKTDRSERKVRLQSVPFSQLLLTFRLVPSRAQEGPFIPLLPAH